jgi:hypothetical protein
MFMEAMPTQLISCDVHGGDAQAADYPAMFMEAMPANVYDRK